MRIKNIESLKAEILSSRDLLTEKLIKYGAEQVNKTHFSCINDNCSSSDALSIYQSRNEQGEKEEIWLYKCFSCNKEKGNVITLVAKKEKISYVKALTSLARELNISVISEYEEFDESYNHAKYKPDEDILIEKYINQNDLSLDLARVKAKNGKISLIIAPTGSGKTYSVINMLKRAKDTKSIFIVPNSMNVEQIKVEYEIPGAWGDIPVLPELEKGNVIVLTWDKFIQLDEETLKDYIVILDEVHQTYTEMFRLSKINKLYDNLECCKGQIHITATPNKLNFEIYNYIVRYETEKKTEYKVFLYSNINDDRILKITNNAIKFALFKDDAKYLEFIKQNTINKKVDIITRNTRDFSDSYKSIVTNNSIGDFEGICNTSLLTAGVNIYEKDITDIIIINVKDPATIKQYVARFRDLDNVNIHIFNNYQEEGSIKKYSIEKAVDLTIKDIEEDVNFYNKRMLRREFQQEVLGIEPVRIPSNINYYWSDVNHAYKVNERAIRNSFYSNYYNKVDIFRFKELLQEYFPNIVVISQLEEDIKTSESFRKASKEEINWMLNKLESHKEILVGSIEILTNKVSSKTDRYLRDNLLTENYIREQLTKHKIDKYIKVDKISNVISLYSKYVIEDKMTYELAWTLATMGTRTRKKFFNQINFILYREIEAKYPNLINKEKIEYRLYNFILQRFEPNTWYNEELLKIFCNDVYDAIKIDITHKQLAHIVNQIFITKRVRLNSCPDKLSIYNKYNMIYPGQQYNENDERVRLIQDFISFDNICKEYKLDDISIKSLKHFLRVRLNNIENDANEILSIIDSLRGEVS